MTNREKILHILRGVYGAVHGDIDDAAIGSAARVMDQVVAMNYVPSFCSSRLTPERWREIFDKATPGLFRYNREPIWDDELRSLENA